MKLEILTPTGFKPFDAVIRHHHKKHVRVTFDGEFAVLCAEHHMFSDKNGETKFAIECVSGDVFGERTITRVDRVNEAIDLYDPANVDDGELYLHDDGIISHNSFLGTSNTLIDTNVLMSLQSKTPIKEMDDVKIYELPKNQESKHNKDGIYVMTVDVCKGRGKDYSTFSIFDVSDAPFKQVCAYRNNLISPMLLPNVLFKWAKAYNDAMVVVESNDEGASVARALYYDLEYENVFVESFKDESGIGVYVDKRVKSVGCSRLKDMMENGQIHVVDSDTIYELTTFTRKGSSWEAAVGSHDDTVSNLWLFSWISGTELFKELVVGVDLKERMFAEKMKAIEMSVPFAGLFDQDEDGEDDMPPGWSKVF